MASVNRVTLIGRVGRTPEIVNFKTGDRIAKVSLATGRKWKDRDGGEHEDTQWHNVIVGGKATEIVEKFVDKGHQLYIEGEIRYRTYDDKDGNTHDVTEIHAVNVQMLGGKPADAQPIQAQKGRRASRPVEVYDSASGASDLPFDYRPGYRR